METMPSAAVANTRRAASRTDPSASHGSHATLFPYFGGRNDLEGSIEPIRPPTSACDKSSREDRTASLIRSVTGAAHGRVVRIWCISGDHAIDLEHLGVLEVHVDAVRAREVPHVFRVCVAAMLLRRVLAERCDLALEMALVEREVRLVGEVEVVPGDLVAEDRRALERAQPLGCDRLMVLVDVVQ